LNILRARDDVEIPLAGEYAIDPAHTSVEFIGRPTTSAGWRARSPGH
jgi:hypothetical protein